MENFIIRLMNTSLTPTDSVGRMLHTFNSTAYEIDDNMIDVFMKNNLYNVELCKHDYLTDIKQKKYDAIICNPPYNKFQEIINRKEYISNFTY